MGAGDDPFAATDTGLSKKVRLKPQVKRDHLNWNINSAAFPHADHAYTTEVRARR
jgi:hypothetical protein